MLVSLLPFFFDQDSAQLRNGERDTSAALDAYNEGGPLTQFSHRLLISLIPQQGGGKANANNKDNILSPPLSPSLFSSIFFSLFLLRFAAGWQSWAFRTASAPLLRG